MRARSKTIFEFEARFEKTVRDFGPSDAALVISDIQFFEQAWRKSVCDDDIPPRYKFKPYRGVHRAYKLCQIYAGPKRKNLSYRVAVMFYDDSLHARWIHAFKKEKMNEKQEVDLAIRRAEEYWNKMRGE